MDVLKEPVGRRFRSGLGEEEVILRSGVVGVSFGLSQGSRQPIGILLRCEFEPRSTTQRTGVNPQIIRLFLRVSPIRDDELRFEHRPPTQLDF